MRADPVGQGLGPARLRKREARCAEHGDEQVRGVHLPGHRVDDVDGVAGPVDEQLVAGHVRLPHDRRLALAPSAVQLAELRVAVAVRAFGPMLLPQDRERHAAPLQLGVHLPPVGHRHRCTAVAIVRGHEQPPLQLGVIDLGRASAR